MVMASICAMVLNVIRFGTPIDCPMSDHLLTPLPWSTSTGTGFCTNTNTMRVLTRDRSAVEASQYTILCT